MILAGKILAGMILAPRFVARMAVLWDHSSNSPVFQGLHTGLRNARESMNFPHTCMQLSGLIPVTSLNSLIDHSIVCTFGFLSGAIT